MARTYEVDRFGFGSDSTLSRLWDTTDGGLVPLAWCLEDERRLEKVFSQTCIPTGTYQLALRTHGGFHDRYTQRFPDFHIGMIEVMDVPDFTGVLWHVGNDHQDTSGCLLLGSTPILIPRAAGNFKVASSVDSYREVYPPIAAALAAGEECTVSYIERRPADSPR